MAIPPSRARLVDRARVDAELAQRGLVLRLAEDGHVARHQLLAARVEVVAVAVGDDHRVEAARRPARPGTASGTVGFGTWLRVARRWPASRHVVEHRIDEDPLARDLEDHGRVSHESQAHGRVST